MVKTPKLNGDQPHPGAADRHDKAEQWPPPSHLSPIAAEEWRALAPAAVAAGTLHARSVRTFEVLTETLATERAARELVGQHGITVTTGAGGVKPHPAVRSMEIARAQAVVLLKAFALDPTPRDGDPIPDIPAASAWSGILPPVGKRGHA